MKTLNIMLYGDGTRLTIISGSRSVGGGSTTFNSTNVGKSFIKNNDIHIHWHNLYTLETLFTRTPLKETNHQVMKISYREN